MKKSQPTYRACQILNKYLLSWESHTQKTLDCLLSIQAYRSNFFNGLFKVVQIAHEKQI